MSTSSLAGKFPDKRRREEQVGFVEPTSKMTNEGKTILTCCVCHFILLHDVVRIQGGIEVVCDEWKTYVSQLLPLRARVLK